MLGGLKSIGLLNNSVKRSITSAFHSRAVRFLFVAIVSIQKANRFNVEESVSAESWRV
jgi:hypothetical protein